jgi:hypothetical protein
VEENLDIVVNPTSAQRGINALIQTMAKLHSTTNQVQGATTALFNALGRNEFCRQNIIICRMRVCIGHACSTIAWSQTLVYRAFKEAPSK